MKGNNHLPFFSIVIPTYNRGNLIKNTLQSLINQTFVDFEIYVIDDGGDDNTREIVADFGDSRINYFWKDNEERAVARNTGANMARGKYINFFDSDDLAYENHLQEAYNFVIKKESPEVFHFAYDYKSPENELLKKIDQLPKQINDLLVHGNILSCNGVFLRKDIAEKFQFNQDRELSATEDYELWMRLASRYPFYNINRITSTIIDHEWRSVIKINKEKLIRRKELFLYYINQDKAFLNKYGKWISKMKADTYTYVALHLAIAKYPFYESIHYLVKSLQVWPRIIINRRFWGTIKTLIQR